MTKRILHIELESCEECPFLRLSMRNTWHCQENGSYCNEGFKDTLFERCPLPEEVKELRDTIEEWMIK